MSKKILLTIGILLAIVFTNIYADEESEYLFPHDYINYVETTDKVNNNITIVFMYNKENNNLIVKTTIRQIEYDEGDLETLTRDKILGFAVEHGYYHFRNYSENVIRYHGDNIVFTRFIYLYK